MIDETVGTEVCIRETKVLTKTYGSFKGFGEKSDDQMESRVCKLVSSVSFNDKIYQMTTHSPSCQNKQSAVIRLSYTRKSYESEEATEFCKYKILTSIF